MKAIPELKKGDMININGEVYQLVEHVDMPGGAAGDRMITLARLGDRNPVATLRVVYPAANPASMRLESLDKKTGAWLSQKLVKFGF